MNALINSIGNKNIIIIVVVIIVGVAIALAYRSVRLKMLRKRLVEVENKISAVKSLPIQYLLGRVKSIAQNMKEAQSVYEEFASEYDSIKNFQKDEIEVLFNDVDEALFYNKITGSNSKMTKLEEMVDQYEKRSDTLLKKIQEVTEIENIQRLEIIKVKEKYRLECVYYESVRYKIDDYIPTIENIFKSVDQDFVKLEDYMNHQQFDDASEFTDEIKKKIDWIHETLADLPDFITTVRSYIPKKISQIQELIDAMPENQYAMQKLSITDRFEMIKNELDKETKNVKTLQLEGIEKRLMVLTDQIDGLIEDIRTEKKSFDLFNEKWDECAKNVVAINERYGEALNDLKDMQEHYVLENYNIIIDQKYEEFSVYLNHYNELIELMETGQFAYSLMIKDVEDLNNQVIGHDVYLNDFFIIRDQLHLQEERAINELENINIVLLEIKSELKNKHLPMISETYKEYIAKSYKSAAEIQKYRNSKPIDLEILSKNVDEARDIIYKFYNNFHNLVVTADMVEEAIVYGNRYRSSFLEVNTELTKTEVLFRNGEYTKALTTAVDIIEKLNPGSYEELIRNSQ